MDFLENLKKELQQKSEVTLKVKVTARSKKNEIVGWREDGILKVKITAVREKGQANEALIRFLREVLALPKVQLVIIQGELSALKTIRIRLLP